MRLLAYALVAVGTAAIAHAVLTVAWKEPATALYAEHVQRGLERDYDSLLLRARPRADAPEPGADAPTGARAPVSLPSAAAAFRELAAPGRPIGRLVVPRLDLRLLVVEGADPAALRKAPGRDRRSSVPGEGRLTYVAGHRTTYGAPFRRIDTLRPGDLIVLEMPYGRFPYRVEGHAIVDPHDVARLRWDGGREQLVLQASHPPYSAESRYLVYGRLAAGGT